jgi:hypothetical protein
MRYTIYLITFLLSISLSTKATVYNTPGTGVNWTLADLVANSGGIVTFNGTEYLFTDSVTVRTGDVLRIETDATVKFNAQVIFRVNGQLIINPANSVLFIAANTATPFRGLWLENSPNNIIRKLRYEYASSLRMSDASAQFEDCIFRYNNSATTLSNGTLSLFRSNPTLTRCQFLNNFRAAIQGGANIANAPKIIECVFSGNNSSNQNVPQINLGASGTDTTKIIRCTIVNPGGIRTGGIGFLPLGNLNVLIEQNYIANNRYGIVLQGGADINSMVRYNHIAFNNIENNPNLGGSGISYAGGSASSKQRSIATGNRLEGNLWGITIQNRAMPNLGNLSNADTSDNGKNLFINNTNTSTALIDLYNNTVDTIYAQGNFWNSEDPAFVENRIFHRADLASLGLVIYNPFSLRYNAVTLAAAIDVNDVLLNWETATEFQTSRFIVEKSLDNSSFSPIDTVAAAGLSFDPSQYDSRDPGAFINNATIYYRLKMIDSLNGFRYSNTVSVKFPNLPSTQLEQYFPTLLNASQPWTIRINSPYQQPLRLGYFAADGKLVKLLSIPLVPGFNQLQIPTDPKLSRGWHYIKVMAIGLKETVPVLIH